MTVRGRWSVRRYIPRRSGLYLCVGAIALVVAWGVRSTFVTDNVEFWYAGQEAHNAVGVTSGRGQLRLAYARRVRPEEALAPTGTRWARTPPQKLLSDKTFWTRAGFYASTGFRPRLQVVNVVIPHWFVALPFASVPAWHAARAVRRRWRLARGRCRKCGYDLRGTPGACPECGAAASG